jgi:hypothetical protein
MSGTIHFIPSIEGETIHGVNNVPAAGATTDYCPIGPATCDGSTQSNEYTAMPIAGTWEKFAALIQTSTGETTTFAFQWAASAGVPSTVISGTIASGVTTVQTFSGTQAVSVGDNIGILLSTLAGSSAQNIEFSGVFLPSTLGQFIVPLVRVATTGNPGWVEIAGRGASNSVAESNTQMESQPMTIVSMAVQRGVATGSGLSETYHLRDNGSSVSGATCAISGASAVNCTVTGLSAAVSQWDLLDTSITESSTAPPASELTVSYGGYLAPAASSAIHHKVINQ